jgi:hypothetical protein
MAQHVPTDMAERPFALNDNPRHTIAAPQVMAVHRLERRVASRLSQDDAPRSRYSAGMSDKDILPFVSITAG